jgi:hypothetical protein
MMTASAVAVRARPSASETASVCGSMNEAVPLRADLRTRAERAEQQADAYRDELHQLRAASSADGTGNNSGPENVKTARCTARTPAT